jgi:isopentenyl diphosphate isomerase/L-lactate dehydrogenase-like FMN-dependent dehydrogenase
MELLTTLLVFAATARLSAGAIIDREGLPDTGLDTGNWYVLHETEPSIFLKYASRTTGVLPPLGDIWDLNDMQMAAKNTVGVSNYSQVRTGALNEISGVSCTFIPFLTMSKHICSVSSLNIWDQVRLNGFSFRDVSNTKLSTFILGHNFSVPFFIAPAANAALNNPVDAEASIVRAAAQHNVLYVVSVCSYHRMLLTHTQSQPSISSTLSIDEIAKASSPGQVMFHQEYIWSNSTRLQAELDAIEAHGFKAIFLTVDNTGINGIRTRSLRYTHSHSETGHSATFDLNSLARLRRMTKLPIIPKGIKTAQDARLCMELGFPAIYVSNHGGRTLDSAPTAVEILLDIHRHAPEVFYRMEVYADGGVRRGSDVIKLLALGARAVGIGRPAYWSNIYGQEGVEHMITMMKQELLTTMQLLGANDVSKLDRSYVSCLHSLR